MAAETVERRVGAERPENALCGHPGVMAESMGPDRSFAVEPHVYDPEPDVPEGGCGG